MKIEKPGFYRTRDGHQVEVAAINPNAAEHARCIGWLNGMNFSCHINGSIFGYKNHGADIVSEWTDPVPWDWSTTPPWLNYLVMDADGQWSLTPNRPELSFDDVMWSLNTDSLYIPNEHTPKWSGDWKKSLTVRPGYKEEK